MNDLACWNYLHEKHRGRSKMSKMHFRLYEIRTRDGISHEYTLACGNAPNGWVGTLEDYAGLLARQLPELGDYFGCVLEVEDGSSITVREIQ